MRCTLRQFAPGTALTALTALLVGTSGCYSAELDPAIAGAFACDAADPEADPCPDGLACVNGRCETEADLPSVLVLSPENEESLSTPAPHDQAAGTSTLSLTLRIQGRLDLVSSSMSTEHVFGEGHVVVFVDGEEQNTVDSGSISASTPVEITVDAKPGPHRIRLQIRRNDGLDYDHEGAAATRLFWLENDATRGQRPYVAFKTPWPGAHFDLEAPNVEIELATLNFELAEAGNGSVDGRGHSHIYYDGDFPACTLDEECDEDYIGVVAASGDTIAIAPNSSEGPATITAVLRNVGHTPYGFPFGCDPLVDADCDTAFDTITINRVEDAR